ncbi:MAG: diguanylate cyclase, partial [Rhodocyclaceae bacterium]|nr:diguanylate cyclase [Rhodocyclaceae bacterium]
MNAQAVGGTGGLFEPGGAALLQSGLEQFAIGPAEQAALRAFADAAADGMLARLAQQVAQQSGVAPGSAAARLVDAFVSEEVLRCQAEGVEKLLGAWLEARSSGVAMHVPARIGAQLQAAVLEEMLAGKSTPARIDAEILAALSRLMLFLCSMLDLGVASWEQSIRRQSGVTDEDTALPNIRALRSLLDDMLATGGLFGLLQLRLEVTATLLRLPEALQRQLLRLVASRMRGALRQQDVICRTSRYEFAVVLPALSSPAQVTLAATKLLRQFDSPFTLHTREYRLVAYVGAVCAPDQANSVDDLLM